MTNLSRPIEDLIVNAKSSTLIDDADVIIVGSGYGGSVAAMRLAGKNRRVVVLERGKEYRLGDFPYDENDIASHIRIIRERTETDASGYSDALFNIHAGTQTDVLVGSGLGGTSLINANVAEEPQRHVFNKLGWPAQYRETSGRNLDLGFSEIKRLLSINPHPSAEALAKYKALDTLSQAIGEQRQSTSVLKPAQIAVRFDNEANAVGVKQNTCTDCGNCITGCNIGAKNTLDKNLLPLAKSRGAEMLTGVTVLSIEENKSSAKKYVVNIKATTQTHGTIRDECYKILTDTLILSAGTLGTNEILQRSEHLGHMSFSKKLGQSFSTNGDGLIMSYAQDQEVNAMAEAEQNEPSIKPGPTIVGISKVQVAVNQNSGNQNENTHLTIEDASVPAPVHRFFKEALVTSAMLQRLSNRTLPAFIVKEGIDPLAASALAAKHSQALLIMGDDKAKGVLSLTTMPAGHENETTLKIDFPAVSDNISLTESNRIVSTFDRKPGLGNGQYAPNPLWQLLPEAASTVLSGAMPTGRAITVHPLGGCAMGDDVNAGVTDHSGNVFRLQNSNNKTTDAAQTYAGLYVLDGSIIPSALEVNPFLTIAAVAWRNSGIILEQLGWQESLTTQADNHSIGDIPDSPYATQQKDKIAFLIQEQLFGQLDEPLPYFDQIDPKINQRLTQTDGLLVGVEAEIADLDQWLDKNEPIKAKIRLYTHPYSAEEVALYRPYGIAKKHITQEPFEELDGTFHLLKEDKHTRLSEFCGGWGAIFAYFKRRESFWQLAKNICKATLSLDSTSGKKRASLLQQLFTFFNIAAMQSRKRKLIYEFKSNNITLRGEKVIGYNQSLKRMWPALMNLDTKISDGTTTVSTRLEVNAEYMAKAGFLKLISPGDLSNNLEQRSLDQAKVNLPEAVFASMSVAGLFARSLFSTNFWEFAGLDYPKQPIKQETTPVSIQTTAGEILPQFETLNVQISDNNTDSYPMLMTKYANKGKPAALLIHGLAQGSQIYWTKTLETNLASFMHDAGYEVWMVDYRLSNHVIKHVANANWTMDEIAQFDIPAMINHVYHDNGQQVRVFAHCVGACTIAMSSLAGYVDSKKIHSAVVNAIHPWVRTSPTNKVRSQFGQFNREWIKTDYLDPIPSPNSSVFHNILDRAGFGLAKIRELRLDDHQDYGSDAFSNGICNRMTLLYGRMWNHKNINAATHKDFAHMFGPAPSKVYQHLYYYSLQKRITDKNGDNVYLKRKNISDNWTFPTLFIHGDDSRVFNPASAIRSAERLAQFTTSANSNDRTLLTRSKVYANYGHMDVIFGKDASVIVYPDAAAFYQEAESTQKQDIPNYKMVRTALDNKPQMGPILRAAWLYEGQIHIRLWIEARVSLTKPQEHFHVKGDGIELVAQKAIKYGKNLRGNSRHWMLDLKLTNPVETVKFFMFASEEKEFDVTTANENKGIALNIKDQGWYKQLRKQVLNSNDKASVDTIDHCSFLVGSCRFPGTVIDNERSDNIFEQMLNHVNDIQATFLIGDQIYVDATDQLFTVDSFRTKFRYRYQRAFSPNYSPNFAKLAMHTPMHFALDDHEYDDNWSGTPKIPHGVTPIERNRRAHFIKKFAYGVRNARRFQAAERDNPNSRATHSAPLFTKAKSPFSYQLESSEMALPTFVLDTRTGRQFRDKNDPMHRHMISKSNRQALGDWLDVSQRTFGSAPKFIMNGSVITPITNSYVESPSLFRRQDNWHGYPKTLDWLFEFILNKQIENVVFIGGDEHFSAVSKICLSSKTTLKPITAWQIVASGLYSPLPFANSHPRDFLWDQSVDIPLPSGSTVSAQYCASHLSSATSQFVRVDANPKQVKTICYNDQNKMIGTRTFDLTNGTISDC